MIIWKKHEKSKKTGSLDHVAREPDFLSVIHKAIDVAHIDSNLINNAQHHLFGHETNDGE